MTTATDERTREAWDAHLAKCRTAPARAFLLAYLRILADMDNAEVVVGETMDGADAAARGLLTDRPALARVDAILIHPEVNLRPHLLIWRIFRGGGRSTFLPLWFDEGADVARWAARGADGYLNNKTTDESHGR